MRIYSLHQSRPGSYTINDPIDRDAMGVHTFKGREISLNFIPSLPRHLRGRNSPSAPSRFRSPALILRWNDDLPPLEVDLGPAHVGDLPLSHAEISRKENDKTLPGFLRIAGFEELLELLLVENVVPGSHE